MMRYGKPRPTSRKNPCNLCGNTEPDCRLMPDGTILCWTYAQAKPLIDIVNGYICTGNGGKGWGTFILHNPQEWSDKQREQREEKELKRQLKEVRRKNWIEKTIGLPLTLEGLIVEHGKFHDQLNLDLDGWEKLRQRGLTDEQIKAGRFRTVTPGQKVNGISPCLPGVNRDGVILTVKRGILIPVFDINGNIFADQVRLDNEEKLKYRWLKSTYSSHVQGEIPLSICRPIEGTTSRDIYLDEGYLKPFIHAQKRKVIVLGGGGNGGQFSSKPKQLRHALEALNPERLIFSPDAGAVRNRYIIQEYKNVLDLLKGWGYENVFFEWWGQIDKSHPDIDELPSDAKTSLITADEFFAIADEQLLWDVNGGTNNSGNNQSQSLKHESLKSSEASHKDGQIQTAITTRSLPQSKISPTSDQLLGESSSIQSSEDASSMFFGNPDSVECGYSDESNGDREISREEWEAKQKELPRAIALSSTKADEVLVTDKAPRAERREFDRKLKRVEEKSKATEEQHPKLGFNCLKEDNPEFEEKIKQAQRKLRSLSYQVDFLAPRNERYLPKALANQLPKSGIIGIKAPKGSGKSFLLKRIIALAKKQGIPVLSITPRIALGREQAFKWEITWIDDYGEIRTQAQDTANQISELADREKKAKEKLKGLNQVQIDLLNPNQLAQIEQERQNLEAEIEELNQQIENVNMASIHTLGLCWDSLWRTKERDMRNSLIIIDEAELGFTHLATSATCRGNRPNLLQVFSNKITECLMSGGRLILSDADLTDVSIDYVRELLQIPLQPYIVVHNYKGKDTRWTIDFRSGSRGSTLDSLMERIKAGEHVAVTTDSQAEAEALERKILAECPELCGFIDAESGEITAEARSGDGICLIRMDSKISQTEAGKDFLSKPNEAILKWRPQVLIYTPTMGVGVSIDETTVRKDFEIDVPYFDVVFGLFFGTIEPSQCRQQLARVRANVERVVWAKQSNKSLEGCSSFLPEEISRNLFKYHQYNLNPIDIARAEAGMDADDGEVMEQLIELYKKSYDRTQKCWNNPHLNLYAKLKARRNYGLWNLAALLREELEDEGHNVICIEGSKSPLIEEIKDIKDEIKLEDATKIAESTPLPTVEDARKVLNSISSTKEDRYAARKTLLADELPGIELTPQFIFEVVLKDGSRWLGRQKLYWHLRNTEATKANDAERLIGQFKKFTNGVPYMPDTRTLKPKIEAIQRSGVLKWLDLKDREKTYTSDSKEAKKFLRKALEAKELLRAAFNLSVTPKTNPIRLAGKLAEKIGFDLKPATKNRSEKNFKLIPQHLTHTDGSPVLFATRDEILEALDRRWKLRKQNSAQTHTQQSFDPKGEPHILLNKKVAHPYPYTQDNRLSSEYECLFEESQGKMKGVGAAAPVGEYECSSEAPNGLEQLIERLSAADSQSQALAAIAGIEDRVEDALLFLSWQQRQRIKEWLSVDNQQVSPDAPIEPLEASLEPGKPCWYLYAGKWVKALLLRLPTDLGEPFVAGQVEISPGFQPLVLSRKFLEPCCG